MEARARELVRKGTPWSSDVSWVVIAAEAAALVALGAFMLLDTHRARDVVLQLIGVVLLVVSGVVGAVSLRGPGTRRDVYDAFRAGVGAATGLIATASWWSDYIPNHAVRLILGWGLIACSVLYIIGLVATRTRDGLSLNVVLIVALTLVLGVLLLTSNDTVATSRITLLGVVFIIFGLLLGGLAYLLSTRGTQRPAPA